MPKGLMLPAHQSQDLLLRQWRLGYWMSYLVLLMVDKKESIRRKGYSYEP